MDIDKDTSEGSADIGSAGEDHEVIGTRGTRSGRVLWWGGLSMTKIFFFLGGDLGMIT